MFSSDVCLCLSSRRCLAAFLMFRCVLFDVCDLMLCCSFVIVVMNSMLFYLCLCMAVLDFVLFVSVVLRFGYVSLMFVCV